MAEPKKFSDLHVRVATISDIDSILEIDKNVESGFDYLPSTIHRLLHDPKAVMMVCEVDGKVVGCATFIPIGPRENTSGSWRLHKDIRGHGLGEGMNKKFRKLAIKNCKAPMLEYGAALKNPVLVRYIKKHNPGMIFREWNLQAYNIPHDNLLKPFPASVLKKLEESLMACKPASLNKVLQPEIMSTINELISCQGALFTYGNNYFPRPVCTEFIRDAAINSNVLISYQTVNADFPVAVSFMSAIPAKIGLRVDLYFFADQCQISVLYSHIIKTLEKIQTIMGQFNVGLLIHFPLLLDANDVQRFVEENIKIGARITTAPFTADTAVAYLLTIVTKSSL